MFILFWNTLTRRRIWLKRVCIDGWMAAASYVRDGREVELNMKEKRLISIITTRTMARVLTSVADDGLELTALAARSTRSFQTRLISKVTGAWVDVVTHKLRKRLIVTKLVSQSQQALDRSRLERSLCAWALKYRGRVSSRLAYTQHVFLGWRGLVEERGRMTRLTQMAIEYREGVIKRRLMKYVRCYQRHRRRATTTALVHGDMRDSNLQRRVLYGWTMYTRSMSSIN